MNIDETALVPYIQRSLVHLPMYQELALSFVRRYGYSGNKDVLLQLFNAAFTRGDWGTAARIVATAKTKDVLRTPEILYRFKSVPASPGSGMTPILQYFTNLLDHDGLNGNESIELIRTVVSQNHVELVQKWLDQDKLTCTEELGDIVKQKDPALALQIYNKAHATTKVLQSCIEQGKIEKIGTFINQMRENSRNLNSSQSEFSSPDFIGCLETLISSGNPASIEASVKLAQELLSDRQRKKGEVEKIINIFVQRHRYKEVTKVLLEYLKDDLPEDADLQTKLFELCFIHNPNVVEAIFQTESFTHFDRQKIGTMAEEAGLIQRALQLATTPEEIKRLITTYFHGTSNCKGRFLTVEQFLCYFDQHLVKNVDLAMECLQEICRSNSHNVQVIFSNIVLQFNEQLLSYFSVFARYCDKALRSTWLRSPYCAV
jgi:clathrin heavy chain